MFKDISNQLSNRKQKLLDAPHSWHNVMWREVVSQIDERPYSALFDDQMGRPNASVRVLIGMMILKEGNGWSDEQLFTECRFNLMVMRSLGLHHLDEDIPVESTYYEFRRLLGEYMESTEVDLLKRTFAQTTSKQVLTFGVSGNKVRMDSKLVNSNIATSNRLHLIVEATRSYVKDLKLEIYGKDFEEDEYSFLKDLQNKSTSNIAYPLSCEQKVILLERLGPIIGKILAICTSQSKSYKILEQVYQEHYKVESSQEDEGKDKGSGEGKIVPKASKEITSDSIQSVHDPEAKYRTKGEGASKQTVKGYHSNITESCEEEDGLNLILDVDVVEANVSEDSFLIPAVENSQKVLDQSKGSGKRIEEVITDGGYDSIENRNEMLPEHMPQFSVAKMKGNKHRYEMNYDKDNNLRVREKETQEECEVIYSKRAQKHVIISKKGDKRYMTQAEIDNYIIHQQIKSQINEESYNLRASAESTIHQVFHRLKKRNKMVYRGLLKCQWYVLCRAFWVNLTRISQKELKNVLIWPLLLLWGVIMTRIVKNKKIKIKI